MSGLQAGAGCGRRAVSGSGVADAGSGTGEGGGTRMSAELHKMLGVEVGVEEEEEG